MVENNFFSTENSSLLFSSPSSDNFFVAMFMNSNECSICELLPCPFQAEIWDALLYFNFKEIYHAGKVSMTHINCLSYRHNHEMNENMNSQCVYVGSEIDIWIFFMLF